MKPKEYLKSIGAISEIGRGRLSAEHKALCAAAAAKGTSIEGFSASTNDSTGEVTVTRTAPTGGIADIPAERFDERKFDAFIDGKSIGIRAVCENCRCSLNYHRCDSPVVFGKVVTIGERTKPLTTRYW